MNPRAFALFHLNLAFSSIPEASRPTVVERCYHPLLDLVEQAGLPLGIELSGWTLERIHEIDSEWVARFGRLLGSGACELVGSGYAQIIGPLVPPEVNEWNQRLGLEVYERELNAVPRIALVNEMAFSSSLIDLYAQAGYEGVIMDRDNVRLALGIDDRPMSEVPTHGVGPAGGSLPVLWADSILFQKLQHYTHGDIRLGDYLDHLHSRIEAGERLLPLYANDAEVFDHRPGRFGSESRIHPEGEWVRMRALWDAARERESLEWVSPSEALKTITDRRESPLTSAAYPIPVKKQAKYNLARWAITGRDDHWLNTVCHRVAARLAADEDPEQWRRLCEAWATDLRTHITQERWEEACHRIGQLAADVGVSADAVAEPPARVGEATIDAPGLEVIPDPEGILLDVESDTVRLTLNVRRGLAIHSLAFASQGFAPVVGTLAHGYFSSIALGADFYTGGVVVELPGEHLRVTDLDWVEPRFEVIDDALLVHAAVDTPLGEIHKSVRVDATTESVELEYRFTGWERPLGTIRAGTVTLIPDAFSGPLEVACTAGGPLRESFRLDGPVDHARATSSLISSTAGLGATDGEIVIGSQERRVSVSWDPSASAVFPMLVHWPSHPGALTRLVFSLGELDDTARPGGRVGSLAITIRSSP